MNNAKMWLVVKPTVGVPLFLTAVAVGSFAVHVAVLSNTSWVADFLSGKPLGTGAMASVVLPETDAAKVAFIPGGSNEVLITMPDGSTARAVLQVPQDMASLN
jgi:light-harvesting protein B-800-850 alpha chain